MSREEDLMLGAESAVRDLLEWVGENTLRPGLIDTPERVARALREMTSGYTMDPGDILSRVFEGEPCDEMVVLHGVRFNSLCEHHMLGFSGVCHVGYLPQGNKVVGLSKMARLVQVFAKRLQIQERMTRQIAEAMMEHLDPIGVGVVVKARHSCMGCRGAMQPDAEMRTSSLMGQFREDANMRNEFFRMVENGG